MKDLYEVMGLIRTATEEDIRKAYRQLAVKYHPDKNPGNQECVEKFKEISNAFEVLSNPSSRAEYDTYGTVRNKSQSPFGQGKPFTSAFDDMFAHFFTSGQRGVRKGENLIVEASVTLFQVLQESEIEVPFTRNALCQHCQGSGGPRKVCSECNGSGVKIIHGKAMTVKINCDACEGSGQTVGDPCAHCQRGFGEEYTDAILLKLPSGVENGMKFVKRGLGQPSTHPKGVPGDLFVVVRVQPHDFFERSEGGNITVNWPFSYSELTFGTEVEVPTLKNKVKINIPPGTAPGTKFRLKQMGLPVFSPDGSIYGIGDQYIIVRLQIPKDLDGPHKGIIEGLTQFEQPKVLAQRTEIIDRLGEDYGRP